MTNLSTPLKALLQTCATTRKIKKDTYLFHQGELANSMYIILAGRVQIGKTDAEGKELTLRICQKNDIVGELILFADHPKYVFSAKCLENGEVGVINRETIEKKLLENRDVAFEFMKWMSDHFRRTQTKFRDLVLNGKKGALYSTLIRMANSYGIKIKDGILIDLSISNRELANFCGSTRENINRTLQELRTQNILSLKEQKIIIHDLERLKELNHCDDCSVDICNID
ncbi:Crp/Fnr family transcriptional regulator [Aneurinibacillus aneurinilyticus]|uniref:Crp/Fnr family transcriptional regulator n=4 Tax=Aneurinibacillus aneurinilyticus TaxID=1391 RepID=A0A848CSZ6_ANEAE|nr:Crp/Fnr family transcriptional regulator [Aneurinibacillus aneurinilyticus]MCI1693080.1 Crp/Fnr family transcriptional regulator [Aneurinibacillus aneurinilyticus]MED0671636.1 Crp/Fnr family transcriptional regulator [Aneurinibacillus aneurinilyticus]MED0709394.1 Crp/Fnr family transcriptional regulator [Aneurinibacillus aneurinilyticus]MED0733894.1 Crp/Fnr family transcriptional regulator [Aneurinibacillus aneurinilyticus]MED0743952.1 Crp/Fnr family transcriptional regulator [Aneurinibacil